VRQPTLNDVLSDPNLFAAWAKVKDNRGCPGHDGISVPVFEKKLLANLATLSNEVCHGFYKPQSLMRIEIPKDNGGTRSLSIPSVRDRLLQTAVALCITPLFEAEFEECSYAYRAGRSVKQAVQRVEQLRDDGYQWVVDADIESFFDEIDHALLMEKLHSLLVDKGILKLIHQWLKSDVADGDTLFQLTKGVPQGSPISPLLSNLYLDQLDEAFLDNDMALVRFADDFLVLCKNKEKAEAALILSNEILDDLRLSLNEEKTRLVDFNAGFRFLGVQFVRTLAIKSKVVHKRIRSLHAVDHAPPPVVDRVEEKEEEIDSTPDLLRYFQGNPGSDVMRSAFAEADLSGNQFVPASMKTADSVASSSSPEDTSSEPQQDLPTADEEVLASTGHDPRLRTLYLTEHDYELAKAAERLVIQRGDEVLKSIPSIKVDQVMIFGNAQITTQAMHYCLMERIPIYLLSAKGRYYGVIDAFDTEPVLMHRDQFLRADDDAFTLNLAKGFVMGKLHNSRLLLKRQSRNRDSAALQKALQAVNGIQPEAAETLEQLRGYEGAAARAYFAAMVALVDDKWGFTGRVKQPPTDPINAMLSYGYTILFSNVHTLLRARGMNPHVGFLHAMRPGHPALASDVMEEFRSLIVDAVVLNLVLNQRLTPEDFQLPRAEGEACWLSAQARVVFITALEAKLNSPLKHPNSGLHLDYRRCIEQQIQHLAAVVSGRQSEYKPMVLR